MSAHDWEADPSFDVLRCERCGLEVVASIMRTRSPQEGDPVTAIFLASRSSSNRLLNYTFTTSRPLRACDDELVELVHRT